MSTYYKNLDKYLKAKKEYLADDNASLSYLVSKYGFYRDTFSKWLKKQGIEIKTPINTENRRKYEQGQEMYLKGMALQAISDKLHISQKQFSLYLKKHIPNEFRYTKEMKHCEFNVDYFENINSSNKAYWFGFLLADGCVVNRFSKI